MKLPKKLKIGYKTYKVVSQDASDIRRSRGGVGSCDHNTSLISVDTSISDETEQLNTLLHEILHACYCVGDLEGGESEEKVVSVLANVLLQVLQDNKIEGINYHAP